MLIFMTLLGDYKSNLGFRETPCRHSITGHGKLEFKSVGHPPSNSNFGSTHDGVLCSRNAGRVLDL